MSTFTFVGSTSGPIKISPESTIEETDEVDLSSAKKVVVDNVVHLDGDHDDVVRVLLPNSLRDAIVVSNTSLAPSERLKITAAGAIHAAGEIYLRNPQGVEFNLYSTLENSISDLDDDLGELETIVGEMGIAVAPDDGSNKAVKRSAESTTVINNLVCRADEVRRSVALYPPPGFLFDKGICETSLSLLDNAQLIFQPYDQNLQKEVGRDYTFGRDEGNSDDKDGLHFQDITDNSAHRRVRITVSETQPAVLLVGAKNEGVPVFEIRDHSGSTMFAISDQGEVTFKGHADGTHTSEPHHRSVAVNDNSLYIGSIRLSFHRANGELVMHVIARVPVYLTALGYTLGGGAAYTDYGVHDYCKFARDLASDQSLKISDVFPTAIADDWTSYLPEATRNINTNITTHLTPMVNPQAYRNIHVEALVMANSPFQVADDTWLQVIKHDNTSGLEVYLPDDPEDGQVSRIKNLNTSGDNHLIVSLNVANIAAGVTIDGRFTSVQLNGSGSGSSPDTQTNQCSTMVFIEDIAAGSYWVRVGDGY